MKKKILILLLVLILAAGAACGVWYFKFRDGGSGGSSADGAVFVDSVGVITGLTGSNGMIPRFAGVVEPQKTEKVELANGMKVKETYVSVGQEVSVGTKLFSYDTEEAQDSVTQLEIDIENNNISIESSKSQIATLEKGRSKVSEDEKLSYTTQIMTIENSIKRYEYETKSKQAEMENLKKRIENAVVTSDVQGIIKSINKGDSSDSENYGYDSENGDSNAYITIMATGEYRVKGTINEQNASQIMEGQQMLIHSRVDESLTWSGILTTIDKENATANQNNSFYYGSGDSSMTNSSSYPFYIELDSSEGLMLGQHVYIEVDQGQGEQREGIWLEDYYFITDEDGAVTPYLWVADKNDRLEKRKVTFGDYDDELFTYQILDGLTVDDYIAYPDSTYTEGMPVTRNVDQLGGGDEYYGGDDFSGFGEAGELGNFEDFGGDEEDYGAEEDYGVEEDYAVEEDYDAEEDYSADDGFGGAEEVIGGADGSNFIGMAGDGPVAAMGAVLP